jgi:tRNA (adenine22-N1)-methyltransferase
MKLPISERLLACCNFVAKGDRVADIGCDHGYLGIHLLTNGIASHMIEADVAIGPLESARRNAMKYHVETAMTFYLSDGVRNIPRDFDTLVCAGMGADTMVSILSAAPWLQTPQYRLILQCQSKTPMLRQYLSANGWRILEESVLKDGKFLYTIMEVVWRPGEALTPGQCHFPPALLKNPSPDLPAYYRWVVAGLETAVENQKELADPFKVAALKELTNLPPELSWLKEEPK